MSNHTRKLVVRKPEGGSLTVDASPIYESDGCEFGLFTTEEGFRPVAYVHYWHANRTFTLVDWQGRQPESLEEIPFYNWIDDEGYPAIVINDMPTLTLGR